MFDFMAIVRALFVVLILIVTTAGVLTLLHTLLMRRITAQWHYQWRDVQFGPVNASCHTLRPRENNSTGAPYGAVGIANNQFVFQSLIGRLYDVVVPLEHVHGVGLRLFGKGATLEKNTYQVQVDFETPGGWQVYTLNLGKWREFADMLGALAGVLVDEYGGNSFEPLAVNATRMTQDIYGQWQSEFTDQFYIGPDRVLFGWHNAIMFDAITQLTLYDREHVFDSVLGAQNPFTQDMLRIDYVDGDGNAQVIGYQMNSARKKCLQIVERSGAPLTIHEGRKKH